MKYVHSNQRHLYKVLILTEPWPEPVPVARGRGAVACRLPAGLVEEALLVDATQLGLHALTPRDEPGGHTYTGPFRIITIKDGLNVLQCYSQSTGGSGRLTLW